MKISPIGRNLFTDNFALDFVDFLEVNFDLRALLSAKMSWSIGEIFNLIDYMPNFRSLGFRKRVIDYVQFEGTITEASRFFSSNSKNDL